MQATHGFLITNEQGKIVFDDVNIDEGIIITIAEDGGLCINVNETREAATLTPSIGKMIGMAIDGDEKITIEYNRYYKQEVINIAYSLSGDNRTVLIIPPSSKYPSGYLVDDSDPEFYTNCGVPLGKVNDSMIFEFIYNGPPKGTRYARFVK